MPASLFAELSSPGPRQQRRMFARLNRSPALRTYVRLPFTPPRIKNEVLAFPGAKQANPAAALPRSHFHELSVIADNEDLPDNDPRRPVSASRPNPLEAEIQLEVNMGIIAWIILGLTRRGDRKSTASRRRIPGVHHHNADRDCRRIHRRPDRQGARLRDPIDEFFDFSTWLGAIAGAILLLLVYRALVGRGTRGRTAY